MYTAFNNEELFKTALAFGQQELFLFIYLLLNELLDQTRAVCPDGAKLCYMGHKLLDHRSCSSFICKSKIKNRFSYDLLRYEHFFLLIPGELC